MNCNYCEWRCNLLEGQTGVCQMYTLKEDQVAERFPDAWTSLYVTHIESIPFFHVFPGSRSMLIGSCSCNMNCRYCSNAHVARLSPDEIFSFQLRPEQIIQKVKQTGCHNLVFGVNEVMVSWPSVEKLGELARKNGIAMGCLSNGYMTKELALRLPDVFSFVNISLKGMNDVFYRDYTGIPSVAPVLRNIKYLAKHVHLELTTPIIQGVNDVDIPDMASFICSVDRRIPWHVFRLLPEYRMADASYPDIKAIEKLLNEQRSRLDHIYFSNFVGSDWVSTLCPHCGHILIQRIALGGCGAKAVSSSLIADACSECGQKVPIYGTWTGWHKGGAELEAGID